MGPIETIRKLPPLRGRWNRQVGQNWGQMPKICQNHIVVLRRQKLTQARHTNSGDSPDRTTHVISLLVVHLTKQRKSTSSDIGIGVQVKGSGPNLIHLTERLKSRSSMVQTTHVNHHRT